jgi:hypothetical protein
MPGGAHDSSRTRVAPVFDLLQGREDDWVRALLLLNAGSQRSQPDLSALNLKFQKGYWGKNEHSLDPAVALLSWLIRNPSPRLLAQDEHQERRLLALGDPVTVARALHALRTSAAPKGWHLLEGPTVPDVIIETPDALVVIEGKRTESGPTLDTTWLTGRHQIWRHIDAAWEIRGRRRVFGFFIVQGQDSNGGLPPHWRKAFNEALSSSALETSFPHRSLTEREAIAACMLGGTTWDEVCKAFGISQASLPRTIHDHPVET